MDTKSYSILVVSNGHGEDTIAACLMKSMLRKNPYLDIKAFPLVGIGSVYQKDNIDIVGPVKKLPTGGFARQSIKHLIKDIKAGLLSLTKEQAKFLKACSPWVDLCICVGDIFPLALASGYAGLKCVFVSTAKSDYYVPGRNHHGHYESKLISRWAKVVFTRDSITSDSLRSMGVNSIYLGNIMMDCINSSGIPLCGEGRVQIVGVLPGTRDEVILNMVDISEVVIALGKKKTCYNILFVVALTSSVNYKGVIDALKHCGWEDGVNGCEGEGLLASLTHRDAPNFTIGLFIERFGDIIHQSEIVIGLSGTGNEQAAGLGKPVVSFPGRGDQFTEVFAKAQKLLLGDSVSINVRNPETIADDIIDLLDDVERRKHMGVSGMMRMGEKGAADKISEVILEVLGNNDHH